MKKYSLQRAPLLQNPSRKKFLRALLDIQMKPYKKCVSGGRPYVPIPPPLKSAPCTRVQHVKGGKSEIREKKIVYKSVWSATADDSSGGLAGPTKPVAGRVVGGLTCDTRGLVGIGDGATGTRLRNPVVCGVQPCARARYVTQ